LEVVCVVGLGEVKFLLPQTLVCEHLNWREGLAGCFLAGPEVEADEAEGEDERAEASCDSDGDWGYHAEGAWW
jgi:hypothetical protein